MPDIPTSQLRDAVVRLKSDEKLTNQDIGELIDRTGQSVANFLKGANNPNGEGYMKLCDLVKNAGYFTRLGFPTDKLVKPDITEADEEQLKAMGIKQPGKKEEFPSRMNSKEVAIAIAGIMSYPDADIAEKHRIVNTLFPGLECLYNPPGSTR